MHLRDRSTSAKKHKIYQLDDKKDQTRSHRRLNKSMNSYKRSAPLRDRSNSKHSLRSSSPNIREVKASNHRPTYSMPNYNHNHESHKDVKDVTKTDIRN